MKVKQSGTEYHTVQVKSLTKRAPAPFGETIENMIAEYVIICRKVREKIPEVFIATKQELLATVHEGVKNNKKSYWWQPKDYEDFRDCWVKIGDGI